MCSGSPGFKKDFLLTLESFSKVGSNLLNNHYDEYKKRLQGNYDELSENPETAHLYKLVDPREKRLIEPATLIDLSTESNKKKRR